MKRRHAEGEFAAVAVRKSKMVTVVAVVILDLVLVLVVARKAVQEAKVVAVVVREMVGQQTANVISIQVDNVQRSKVS